MIRRLKIKNSNNISSVTYKGNPVSMVEWKDKCIVWDNCNCFTCTSTVCSPTRTVTTKCRDVGTNGLFVQVPALDEFLPNNLTSAKYHVCYTVYHCYGASKSSICQVVSPGVFPACTVQNVYGFIRSNKTQCSCSYSWTYLANGKLTSTGTPTGYHQNAAKNDYTFTIQRQNGHWGVVMYASNSSAFFSGRVEIHSIEFTSMVE